MIANYANMTIPIVSSISLGRTFGDQIECGDFVDEARIKAALAQCFAPVQEHAQEPVTA